MNQLCDICGIRQATTQVTVTKNGQQRHYNLCPHDFSRFQQQANMQSPFDALFGLDAFLGTVENNTEAVPEGMQPSREAIDVTRYLSDHSKQQLQRAAEFAATRGRLEIDTEHLLVSLCQSEVAISILKQAHLDATELASHLLATMPEPQSLLGPTQLGVTPHLKRALELSLRVSRQLGHGYIGPEHLLIALAEEGEGVAAERLLELGLSPEKLRQLAQKVVGKGAQDGKLAGSSTTPHLDKYSRDLSELARQGKLDPVIGRADEIETTIEILARRTKNNPALIGEPGVGKTAIVEGLAQRILSGEVPEPLQNKRVVELNISSMVAGTKFRGDFEERVQQVLHEILQQKEGLIVFVDELHTIIGAGQGGGEGGLDIANVIKPALARGELHLIGATTLAEYKKYIEKDSALERRFQPVQVPEPSVEQTIQILRGLRDRYEAYHRVKISDAALVAAASLSDRYISHRFLPDKAIDLIDQAASKVRIALTSKSPEMQEVSTQIARLERELELAHNHRQYDTAKELKTTLSTTKEHLHELEMAWRSQKGAATAEVDSEMVARVVHKLTGVPVAELTQEERERLLNLEEKLHERVVGQGAAVVAVADAIRRSRAGLSEGNRPLATFLFLGPTGVGKTELAKALAATVFGDESAIIRLDMSEYSERHAVARMIGSPPGYVGHDEGGQLTDAVRRKPYSVVLLDEIEKAHPETYNTLLQVLDEGRLTDGKGKLVSFANTVIIATSNVGAGMLQAAPIGFTAETHLREEEEQFMEAVKGQFKPEFINRLDDMIVFHPLSQENIQTIVRAQLAAVVKRVARQGIVLRVDEAAASYLAEKGYSSEYGARELKRIIKAEVENRLAKMLLAGALPRGGEVRVRLSGEHLDFTVPEEVTA